MITHWKAVVGVILIFVFGFLSGVLCTSIVVQHRLLAFYQHPMVAVANALEKRLTGNLNLDANQKQQIHTYFMENLQQRKELQKQLQPQVQMINLETFREIKGVLRPDQLDLFHQNIDKFRKHFGKALFNTNAQTPPDAGTPLQAPATNSGASSPPPH